MPSILLFLVTGLSGIGAHLGVFIRGEWHLHTPQIIFTHAVLLSFVWFLSYRLEPSINAHFYAALQLFACYLVLLFGSIVTYRLFFHPLRRFPGPKLAAVTKFWHVWQARNCTNHLVMWEMYKRYGPVVRTGPNDICIFHQKGIELLDGPKSNSTKDAWYDVLHPRSSVVFDRDPDEVRARRLVWNQAFSTTNVKEYARRIAALAEDLVDAVSSYKSKAIKLNDLMSWFAFDAMGLITFGEDFGMVKSQQPKSELLHIRGGLKMITPLNDAIWMARVGLFFFPFLKEVRNVFKTIDFCWECIQTQMKVGIASFFIEEYRELEGQETDERRHNLLLGSTISAVVAGSDTTRAGLIAMIYYVCKYPDTYSKIYKEVKDVDVTDMNILAILPHLNATVKEVLRIAPPALSGGSRMTGPDGLWVDGIFIPAGVKVTAPKYVSHRLPSAFKQADEFIPERWYSRPELVLDQSAYAPFSIGPRQCIGRAVSLLEMRLVTAILLKNFHISFSENHDAEKFWANMRDEVTMQAGDLFCIFKPRFV